MKYDELKNIYFEIKKYLVHKLINSGYNLDTEEEGNQPFGSMYCLLKSDKEYLRFIFDNRENWFLLENSKNNKSWNEIYLYKITSAINENKIKYRIIEKIKNYIGLE